MSLDLSHARRKAEDYIGRHSLAPRPLGFGIGGTVFYCPELQAAVKVHRHREGFSNEVAAYDVLAATSVVDVCGLHVPKLLGRDETLLTFHMDVVTPPYLLDFAGVLFEPPDFSDDVMQDWHERIADAYGDEADRVYEVYAALQRYGIWYLDFRKSNVRFDALA